MQRTKALLLLLMCVCLLGACGKSDEVMSGSRTVEIYYVDNDMLRLIPVEVPVKKQSAQKDAEFVLDKLIEGDDTNPKVRRLIPKEKGCVTVQVENDTAIVNFSQTMLDAPFEGRDLEVLAVYQIVNSMTSVEGITTVKFTINGERQADFKGFLDMKETFIPDYML